MYLAAVTLLMSVLPVASVLIEGSMTGYAAGPWFLIGKWFVFWAVGVRLALVAVSQIARPAVTANTLFGIEDRRVLPLVLELGFGNLAIGALALVTMVKHEWTAPAAVAGEIVSALSGLKLSAKPARSRSETIVMISDLWVFAVLSAYLTAMSI